jgi:hypothetical protein
MTECSACKKIERDFITGAIKHHGGDPIRYWADPGGLKHKAMFDPRGDNDKHLFNAPRPEDFMAALGYMVIEDYPDRGYCSEHVKNYMKPGSKT